MPQILFAILVCPNLCYIIFAIKSSNIPPSPRRARLSRTPRPATVRDGLARCSVLPRGRRSNVPSPNSCQIFLANTSDWLRSGIRSGRAQGCVCLTPCAFLSRRKGRGQNAPSDKQWPAGLGKRNWDRKQTVASWPRHLPDKVNTPVQCVPVLLR